MTLFKGMDFRLHVNPRAAGAAPYAQEGRSRILSLDSFAEVRREICSWPDYRPTPLHDLRGLAAWLGVRALFYKDEADRFGLGSFKALGGAFAVFRLLRDEIRRRHGIVASSRDLASGRYADLTSGITVTCATDGNHGRSVAWGAGVFHCRCVIYVHANVSEGRASAIAAYGADVRRIQGTYDDAVRQAAADASAEGWHVVSDTSYDGYVDVPRDVMQGYCVMADEALKQLPAGLLPTHLFVQGGVGGLAAAICSYFWERLGAERPRFIVVEPDKADCLFKSAVNGKPTVATGALNTIMAGLACGEVSSLAWQILKNGADAFITVVDDAAAETMRLLARGCAGDPSIVAGESAVAGLAGFIQAAQNDDARKKLSLGPDSIVLLFGTEGATDPEVYHRIVGRSAEDVKMQAA